MGLSSIVELTNQPVARVDHILSVGGLSIHIENKTYRVCCELQSRNSCDSWSEDADKKYPPGSEVTVYVNPDNPAEAVLENGFSGLDFGICCIPICYHWVIMLVGMLGQHFQPSK